MARRTTSNVIDLIRVDRDLPRAGCWRLVIDDPSHANALSPTLVAQLADALREAIAHDAHAIVLDSGSERFCAGFDLHDAEHVGDAELRERFESVETLLESLRRAPL
ncbi:MAG TPA: enoyl-CoA hydratase-related protein, partial [Casimicrobiaceae bacterium]|nr:enoyl-CoA hydratase-related protein [Casimicrobiaceae bacterium]